jgi:hypothetical protein
MLTRNWAGDTPWALIKAVVWYEYHNENVNQLKTAIAVFRYLNKHGDFETARVMDEQWKRDEYLHLAVLDYFSMFEPVYNY